MTPAEVFRKIYALFSGHWNEKEAAEWMEIYKSALKEVREDRLKRAFDKTMAGWTYARPPRPGDILANVDKVPTGIGNRNSYNPWPYAARANKYLREDFKGQQAVSEGWASGLWQFIAKEGAPPSINEEMHIRRTQDRIDRCLQMRREGKEPVLEVDDRDGTTFVPVTGQALKCMEAIVGPRRDKIIAKFAHDET